MPVNKRSKYRGSRTCGGGTHKNRRGGGSRGGRGNAGGCKHHFVRYYLQGKTFGKNGFHNPTPADVEAMDLGTLDLMVDSLLTQGIARKEGKTIALDAGAIGVDKILGQGRVSRALKIQARAFSEAAKRKIEKQGGQALVV
jgi:large subunit ribosomal protein L15